MKIRTCFVSNSSSSSFVVQGTDVEENRNRIAKALDSCPQLKGLGREVVENDSILRLYPITNDFRAADRRRIYLGRKRSEAVMISWEQKPLDIIGRFC